MTILHHHQLKIVSLDISIDTTEPKVEQLSSLITPSTVALLISHIYGKWCPMDSIVNICKQHRIKVIEDCAEGFYGFQNLGHPKSDLTLFSFGIIKTQTAFGGNVTKVRDQRVYERMVEMYEDYPRQTNSQLLQKLAKWSLIYIFMKHQWITKRVVYILRSLGYDHKPMTVRLMRGFPNQLIKRIREQPSDALLSMLHERYGNYLTLVMVRVFQCLCNGNCNDYRQLIYI